MQTLMVLEMANSSPFADALRKPDGTFAKTRTVLWTEDIWDDGFIQSVGTNKARFKVYRPDFPRSSATGWALRSLVVWWLRTGVVPAVDRIVHHVDENKLNDRFDNLQYLTHSEHQKTHRDSSVERVCGYCGKTFSVPQWRINGGRGKWCSHICGIHGGRWRKVG